MEAYRELFAVADGASLLKLLEKKPEFEYDDDIVQMLSGRTDLGDHANELLNIFAAKKRAIRQQSDVFDFAVTRERDSYFVEYFKQFNGFYLRRRYDLFAINDRMTQQTNIAPASLFVRAVEETPFHSTIYHKVSDYKCNALTHKDLESMLSLQRTRLNPEVQKFQFYTRCRDERYIFIPMTHPYSREDIERDFQNRGAKDYTDYNGYGKIEGYISCYCDARYGTKINSVKDYLKAQGVEYLLPAPFSFYLLQLITAKLRD